MGMPVLACVLAMAMNSSINIEYIAMVGTGPYFVFLILEEML